MTAALLALLLSQDVPLVEGTPDAGCVTIDVERARLLQQDGGVVAVTDGAWMSTDELVRQARAKRDLRAQNDYLEAHAVDVPFRMIAAGVLFGVVAGATAVVGVECGLSRCFGLRR